MYDQDEELAPGELLNQLEEDVSRNQEIVNLSHRLERLRKNPDFIEIIEKGYLTDKAVSLVASTGMPGYAGQIRDDIEADIRAIGKLRAYFNQVYHKAEIAENNIANARSDIADIMSRMNQEEAE